MDRTMLERHLAQAERHVLEGQKHLARQREIVAELSGPDLKTAQRLLAQFETMQIMHVTDRDRVTAELAKLE